MSELPRRTFWIGLPMISAGLIALAAPALVPGEAVLHRAVPSAPRIVCEIEMPNWCLAHFGGTINMVDRGDNRVWSLQSKVFMKQGPLVIIENKACGASNPLAPKFVRRATVKSVNGQQTNSVVYQVATGGCVLQFRWPVLKEEDRSYEQTMLYGVLIGEQIKTMQLYRLLE